MNRLKSLDGIRGLAILAVFFNHIQPQYVFQLIPPSLFPITGYIFNSGVLGVSFLFVLSGFLMAYIYPQPNAIQFLQKRYTRIFPLFLTMSFVALLLSIFPVLRSFLGIALMLGCALVGNLLWMNIGKKIKTKYKTYVFLSFITLQIIVGGFYMLWIMRHPPVVFNQQFPFFLREGIIGLVNSTLTLPLGNYIPMLDGVYWSLASEILFYILYPIICVPIINFLIPQKRILKYIFLISLMPLFVGIDLLSKHLWGLSMLQFPIFYCFVTGMSLGYLFRKKPEFILKITGIFKGWTSVLTIIFLFLVIYFYHFTLDAQTNLASWWHVFWAIPFTFIIALSLDSRNLLSKFFSSKVLVFFGLISYSVYLSHSSLIHIAEALFKPIGVLPTFIFITGIFLAVILISSILHYLLERPYFIREKTAKKAVNPTQFFVLKPAFTAVFVISAIYIFAVLSVYQSNFNFFSIERTVNPKYLSNYPTINGIVSMKTNPFIKMQIVSQNDNLEIITMNVKRESITNNSQNILTFRIKEAGQKGWYSVTNYKLSLLGDAEHPFGFPPIAYSKNKTFDIELQLYGPSSDFVVIDTAHGKINTVFPVNKNNLIKNPKEFISFTYNRLGNVFRNPEAKNTTILFIPFLAVVLFVLNPFAFRRLRALKIEV